MVDGSAASSPPTLGVLVHRLMGRAASHVTLECALQTHPQVALISEEVDTHQWSLHDIASGVGVGPCLRWETRQGAGTGAGSAQHSCAFTHPKARAPARTAPLLHQ